VDTIAKRKERLKEILEPSAFHCRWMLHHDGIEFGQILFIPTGRIQTPPVILHGLTSTDQYQDINDETDHDEE
jgi:hypothetical protein